MGGKIVAVRDIPTTNDQVCLFNTARPALDIRFHIPTAGLGPGQYGVLINTAVSLGARRLKPDESLITRPRAITRSEEPCEVWSCDIGPQDGKPGVQISYTVGQELPTLS